MVAKVTIKDIEKARKDISPYLIPSPLLYSPVLSEFAKREIYCKWESKHKSGSFKERGALNFLVNLTEAQRKQGVCAASLGNHARGLSLNAQKLGVPCTIVMPEFAPLVKIRACEKAGAKVILFGDVFDEALKYALDYSTKNNLIFVHPFDHPLVIAGQGTCGLEILEQLPDLDAVLVPVGGGGLISGIATAIKETKKDVLVAAVQSEWAVAHQNKSPGAKVVPDVTIADGIAVKKIGAITGEIIQSKVDTFFVVSDLEMSKAVVNLLELEKSLVEGAGAAPLAAVLKNQLDPKYKKIVLVISGGNIDVNLISSMIQRDLIDRGRRMRIRLSIIDRPGMLHKITAVIASHRANVMDVLHDRFGALPGVTEVEFMIEIHDRKTGDALIKDLEKLDVKVVWIE